MKKSSLIFAIAFPFFIFLTSCQKDSDSTSGNQDPGRVILSLTDSPIDQEDVVSVFITFTRIDYRLDGEWYTFDEFDEPVTIDLLELTNGQTVLLGDFNSGSGVYSELRFILDAPELNGPEPGNPGCYILFEDGTTQPLFVPSGAQSGFKAKGSFTVPAHGIVHVTADFDVRKSVVVAGNSGKYILKPVIRIVVNDHAGSIQGTISNASAFGTLILYVYEHGTYDESEADDPEEGFNRFPNAVSSSVATGSTYMLPFLVEGMYDVVLTEYIDGEFEGVLLVVEGVEVKAGEVTTLNLDPVPPVEVSQK
ncbi:MAG: DUF4382 domain-containing protein [Bacteroidales bacterium]